MRNHKINANISIVFIKQQGALSLNAILDKIFQVQARCEHLMLLMTIGFPAMYLSMMVLRSEIPSGMCAKLRTVAASNNRVHMP